MSPLCRSISDTELAVLKALWEVGEATVRDLQEHLSVAGFNWAYTTVQTLLNRLEQKECVASTKHGRAFRFCVTTTRDDLLHRELGDLAEELGDQLYAAYYDIDEYENRRKNYEPSAKDLRNKVCLLLFFFIY